MQTGIPASLTAGDRWSWDEPAAFAAYPAPDWALTYHLRPERGGAGITAAGVWNADSFRLTVPSGDTAGLAPGVFVWAAVVENDATGDRVTLARGRVNVLPDPVADTGDARSDSRRILDAITATIEGRAGADVDSYSIEGRSLTRTPLADLHRLREIYARKVALEEGRPLIRTGRIALC